MLDVPAVTESAATDQGHVMAGRQGTRRLVHFDDGDGVVCWRAGADPEMSTDPRETTCRNCEKQPVWVQAWKDAARKVSAP